MICSPWLTPTDLVACGCPDATASQINSAIETASEVLYALSGRQYSGSCSETLRPCSGGSMEPGFSWSRWTYPWYPIRSGGSWVNIGPNCGCHISYECGCGGIPQVNLGRSDVTAVYAVDIAGTTLNSSSYRLDEGRYLVRTDGEMWPCCQNLWKDLGEAGTWYIELEYGTQPPTMGKAAATKLALELVKACTGADCDLPQRVTNIARQGVTLTLLDPQDFLSEGRTGMYEVDLFIKSVNPHGLTRRASAWSPEVAGKGRRVGSIGS